MSKIIEELKTALPKLGEGLTGVDISLLDRDLVALSKLESNEEIYKQLSKLCSDKVFLHPDWSILSGRAFTHFIKKLVPYSFSESTKVLTPILNKEYVSFIEKHPRELDDMIEHERDYMFDDFGIRTLYESYLLRLKRDNRVFVCETPQYMYLRNAVFLWQPDIERIKQVYNDLSLGGYSHASPNLFNAGTYLPALGSCFLSSVDDHMGSIAKSWHDTAIISANSGGLGFDYSALRHSEIRQFGASKGIVPWLKIKNEILLTIDQCGRRKGSGTIYLCDWHVDIEDYLDLRKNNGSEDMRARDLFYALWISDLFMRRVEEDGMWSLFCPNRAKGLVYKWGTDFEIAYLTFESTPGLASKKVRARDLWEKIILTQCEVGMPFMLYKDACNRKSNQNNLGTIRCSNLCVEIVEYTSPTEIASCILSSVSLNQCIEKDGEESVPGLEGVKRPKYVFNFYKLEYLTSELVKNMNRVIDRNYYPEDIPEIKYANLKNRPIGIGYQGLADTFVLLDLPWESEEAQRLNSQISETMYYAAIRESIELAKKDGRYESFADSPASKGLFQFDLWDLEKFERDSRIKFDVEKVDNIFQPNRFARYSREDWNRLRQEMVTYGLRNSLLIALMPTASTAHIRGNNESFEPFGELIRARTILAGQYVIINRYLAKELEEIDLWTTETVRNIISNKGSIQNLVIEDKRKERVEFLKKKYKTANELPQKVLAQYTIDRGRFICQSQSFNCWMSEPNYQKLTSFHFFGWKQGLKTGMYYLRQRALTDPLNFSLDTIVIPKKVKTAKCNDEICLTCQA